MKDFKIKFIKRVKKTVIHVTKISKNVTKKGTGTKNRAISKNVTKKGTGTKNRAISKNMTKKGTGTKNR